MKKAKKQNYIWYDDNPVKAGVYKTRCLRDNSEVTNYGYRYFFKELGWSRLMGSRALALEVGKQKKIAKRDLSSSKLKIQYTYTSARSKGNSTSQRRSAQLLRLWLSWKLSSKLNLVS